MRGTTMFLLGAIAGVVAMATIQRMREMEESEDTAALTDKLSIHLDELEGRLSPSEERAS